MVSTLCTLVAGELYVRLRKERDTYKWTVPAQQEILETPDVSERLNKLGILLKKETEILDIQKNIRSRVEKEMGDTQREFLLREQMKIIQQELGERSESGGDPHR